MILCICTFTNQGEALAERLLADWEEVLPMKRTKEQDLREWTGGCFQKRLPILFIGAAGIAVRSIAPFAEDKLSDSPVLVMDEQGRFVIPILSGHMGGANELALQIAARLGAIPVITTATDVEDLFAVDTFAKAEGLLIRERTAIRKTSAKLLRGEPAGIGFAPDIVLYPKEYILGIGCRKGKRFEELKEFVEKYACRAIGEHFGREIAPEELPDYLAGIASVDVKSKEQGLVTLAQYYHVPFTCFSAEELEEVKGDFSESEFVKARIGVSNVCERSAMRLAGDGAKLVQRKLAENGMTIAIAKRRVVIEVQPSGKEIL